MALGVMKVIGIDFVVVLIFYSFNNVFVSCWVYKIFVCEWIGLLSDYHNTNNFGWGADGSNDLTLHTVNSPHHRSIGKLWVGNAPDRDALVDS